MESPNHHCSQTTALPIAGQILARSNDSHPQSFQGSKLDVIGTFLPTSLLRMGVDRPGTPGLAMAKYCYP